MEVLRNTPIHCIAALLMLNKGRYVHYAFARETMPRKRLTQESVRKLNPIPGKQVSVFDAGMPGLVLGLNQALRRGEWLAFAR